MKKHLLLVFLLVGSSVCGIELARGTTLKKEDVSIRYDFRNEYISWNFGTPYCLEITNHRNNPILVKPSIVANARHSYQDFPAVFRSELKITAAQASLLTVFGAIYCVARSRSKFPWEAFDRAISTIGMVGLGSFTSYICYKLATQDEKTFMAELKKELLHEDIVIQPGQTVEKLFWPQDHGVLIVIDFDAIA